jgi:SAM-dependent methyltransferase
MSTAARDGTRWRERQAEMERSYRELFASPAEAVLGYQNDYRPLAPLLGGYGGLVLDVGGGHGVARHYLPAATRYVVLEPSLEWLRPEWKSIAHVFPCLEEPACWVRGTGEELPFGTGLFSGVLSLWSLNHARRPQALVAEAWRVLRPGGRFLVVLEDMAPKWSDLGADAFRAGPGAERLRVLGRKLWSLVAGWPLQSDHLRIRERDFLRWAVPGFTVARRDWLGAYLSFELVKAGGAAA